MRTTLKDVAKLAGVSYSSVSLVLSGRYARGRISDATVQRVHEAAQTLDYHPNINARTLAGQASKLIGILVDANAPSTVHRLVRSLENEATQKGFQVVVGEAHDDVRHFCDRAATLRQYGVDGIVCCGHDFNNDIDQLREYFYNWDNVVFVGLPEMPGHPYTYVARENGIAHAVRELRKRQRKRIGLITVKPLTYASIAERLRGFRREMPNAEEYIFILESSAADFKQAALETLEQIVIPHQLDAVLMPNDLYAHALLSEMLRRNWLAGKQLAVIGHDNDPFSAYCYPPLSTIDENTTQLAINAMSLMTKLLSGEDVCQTVLPVEPDLIIRESM